MSSSLNSARIKPPALRHGDAVGIVAPASYFDRADFEAGCDALRRAGYVPVYDDSIFDRDLYFAGTTRRRARELEEMFQRDDVKAILCVRGGYGANYLLPEVDLEVIRAHPKILVGYSDVTSLLTHFCDAADLVTFHGPMVGKDFARPDGTDPGSWQSALAGAETWLLDFAANPGVKTLRSGSAEGVLYGGCLSMLAASLGTLYEIRTENTILFIEDVATKPFQIDRMLMQLKLGGKLQLVRGIVFGEMLDCVQAPNQPYSLEEVVMRVVGDLGVPVAYGLHSGHVSRKNMTLPLGIRVRLEAKNAGVRLQMLESATIV
jgi:muramoyltetrapeptide carboxypeptidase